MSSDIPRRAYLERLTPAETAIRNAILEVEKVGADERLTDAVILLQAAKDSVGDYVDGYNTRRGVIEGFCNEGAGVIIDEKGTPSDGK